MFSIFLHSSDFLSKSKSTIIIQQLTHFLTQMPFKIFNYDNILIAMISINHNQDNNSYNENKFLSIHYISYIDHTVTYKIPDRKELLGFKIVFFWQDKAPS